MFSGCRPSAGEDEDVLEMDGGNDFTNMNVLNATFWNEYLKVVKIVNVMFMYILPQFFFFLKGERTGLNVSRNLFRLD